MTAPLVEVTSHIDGKNATLRVFPDRVEWERAGTVSAGRVAAAAMTGGLSLLAGGLRGRHGAGTQVIPMRSVSSVSTRRETMLNDAVLITTAGSVIAARCSRADAEAVKAAILGALLAG